jgi:hypothetical protein
MDESQFASLAEEKGFALKKGEPDMADTWLLVDQQGNFVVGDDRNGLDWVADYLNSIPNKDD